MQNNGENPIPVKRRIEVTRSVAGFEPTQNVSALGTSAADQVFRFCNPAKVGGQLPLFREESLSEEIVHEHRTYPDPPSINVYSVVGGALWGAGLLMSGGKLWLPTDCYPAYLGAMCEQADGQLPEVWRGVLNREDPERIHYDAVCACLLHPNLVYGHFLLEMLPKLYLLNALRAMGTEFRLVLNETTPRWARQFIGLYFNDDEIIWHSHRSCVLTAKAFIIPSMMHQSHNFHPLFNVALNDLLARASTVGWLKDANVDHRLVYLSRSRLTGGWHKIINEIEVEDVFRDAGFAIIHPETLTMMEQLAIYQDAYCLAGAYSSALHNSLFMRSGTKILSINRINWYQSMIAQLRQQWLGYIAPDDGVMRDWRCHGSESAAYIVNCTELRKFISDFVAW